MQGLDVPGARAARRTHALLDVRDEASFRAGHLECSGNLSLAELTERRGELPPRDAHVLVIASSGGEAMEAARQVEALGYSEVSWLDARPEELAGELIQGPATRLWRPSPFLERMLSRLPDPRQGRDRVLDLAAGSGRESVFLGMHGYRVEAWDHDGEVLEKAKAMAARHGVTIETEVRNLELREPRLPIASHDVVMVFRFLHRALFPAIAGAVDAGGCVVYETYLRGQERFGRPKHPRFLLDSGELPTRFPGFEIEIYEEQTPDSGPFLARLLARKPLDSSAGPPAP